MNVAKGANMRGMAARIKKNWQQASRVLGAARKHGGSSVSLFLKLAWLYGIRRFSLREISGYDLLHEKSPVPVLVSKQESLGYLKKVNPPHYLCLTENKIIFDAICTARGLSVPRCYGTFVNGRSLVPAPGPVGLDAGGLPLPDNFIVKPAGGAYGRSVAAWTREGAYWVTSSGQKETRAGLTRKFLEESRASALILQERIHAHPDIVDLSGFSGVQTLRLVSLRSPEKEGDIALLFGNLKLMGREAVVDNFSFGHGGNLLCPIDVTQGMVTRALWRNPVTDRLVHVSHHPTTGRELHGFRIPYWEQINDLVRRAADVFFLLPAIGWDIAITPDGPMLIEGNARWDPSIAPREIWDRIRGLAG